MKDNIVTLYDEVWDDTVYQLKEYFIIEVMFCKSFVDYGVSYLLTENDLQHLKNKKYFKILADQIRQDTDPYKERIFNFKS